ncbi:MAG: MnhB domain-containing protein [Coraliomargarita sp.]
MRRFVVYQSSRLLFPALIVLSLIVFYRGHNLPGGGFIGGLLAASAFILLGLGASMEQARRALRVDPVTLMALGLLIALVSGLFGLMQGDAFMTGVWLPTFYLPLLGAVHLGTPLLFDLGVFMTVIGFTLHTTFSLAALGHEDEEELES